MPFLNKTPQYLGREKNFWKNEKKLKKSVDKRKSVWYSNKADAAEGAGGASKESPVYLEN